MSILELPQEKKEIDKINRRRLFEEERKKRIFDPKIRQIFVDKNALKTQVEERKWLEAEERTRQEAFEKQADVQNQLAAILANQLKNQKRQLNEDTVKYQQIYQKPEYRREFDLNDPAYLKKSKPARTSDNDPTLTISSAQKFEGEDLSLKDRIKTQSEQLRQWLDEQIEERKQMTDRDKIMQCQWADKLIERDQRALKLELMEKECQRSMQQALDLYNAALAAQQKTERHSQSMQNLQKDKLEMSSTANSDLLTEPLYLGFMSALGPGRINCPLYKGMTPEMIEEIQQTQSMQIEEKKRQREKDMATDQAWQELMETLSRKVMMESEQHHQGKKEVLRKVMEENKYLSQLQKEKQSLLNRSPYMNIPTQAYFNQFNTSSR